MHTVGASRHRMFLHLFSALLLVFLISCACGLAHADSAAQEDIFPLFVPKETRVPEELGDKEPTKDVNSFHSPFLLSADGMMLAFAAADYKDGSKRNTNIVAKYIATGGEDWAARAIDGSEDKWKTQLIMRKEENGTHFFELRNPVSVIKNNKIYLLAVVYKKKSCFFCWSYSAEWEFVLAVGEIKGLAKGGSITRWQTDEFLSSKLTKEFKDHSWGVLQHGWSAFLTKEEQIVFVVGAKNEGGKHGSAIIHLEDSEKNWEVVYDETAEGCSPPQYFEWEGKFTRVVKCSDDSQKMEESADVGRTWTNADGQFSHVWTYMNDTGDFTTATIEDKKVLLFTQTTRLSRWLGLLSDYIKVLLFVTDGNSMHEVGLVVDEIGVYVPSGSLQHTNGELFFLYKQNNAPKDIHLVRLKHKLKSAKSVLGILDRNVESFVSQPTPEKQIATSAGLDDGSARVRVGTVLLFLLGLGVLVVLW